MKSNPPKSVEDQELDLSVISKNIGNAFRNFNTFLYDCIQFVLRNIIIISLLLIVGVALGLYLDRTQKTYDHQIIVTPNFGSVDYLYGKIELIDSKIKERDTVFLKSIGIQEPEKLLKIEITPIVDIYKFVDNNEQNFELLKLLADESDIKKIVEERPTSKNYLYHSIAFTTKRRTTYTKTVEPLLAYLNNSAFYQKIQKEYVNNVQLKIKANEQTIAQIDGVLNEFAKNASEAGGSNQVYINESSQLNDVIKTKNELINEQGNHRINLVSLNKIVKVSSALLNIENNKSVNGKMKLILPLLFLLVFILLNRFRGFYVDQKRKHTLSN